MLTASFFILFCHIYKLKKIMPAEQYHEPVEELSRETRTFARKTQSMIEEAEGINWYEQRISLEKDMEAKAIMENASNKMGDRSFKADIVETSC
jgi:hypothetical protein